MMEIQWRRRGSRLAQLESWDEEEMIWHSNSNEKEAALLPDDTKAVEYVIYLLSGG